MFYTFITFVCSPFIFHLTQNSSTEPPPPLLVTQPSSTSTTNVPSRLPLPPITDHNYFDLKISFLLYTCLEVEKMWKSGRKYIFRNIFKKANKYFKKIFYKTFSEMQPNTLIFFFFKKYCHLKIFYGWKFFSVKPNTTLI